MKRFIRVYGSGSGSVRHPGFYSASIFRSFNKLIYAVEAMMNRFKNLSILTMIS